MECPIVVAVDVVIAYIVGGVGDPIKLIRHITISSPALPRIIRGLWVVFMVVFYLCG